MVENNINNEEFKFSMTSYTAINAFTCLQVLMTVKTIEVDRVNRK